MNDPKHWRDRAEEARALADKMPDPISKHMVIGIAQDYEKLAERAEERKKGGSGRRTLEVPDE
jgi:hypothetical protein